MTRIGIVSDRRYITDLIPCEIESFSISPTNPTFRQIFDSAFSTPSRYLVEIIRRLIILGAGNTETLLVFNPLFRLSTFEIWLVLNNIDAEELHHSVTILTDRDGHPLLYGLPPTCHDSDLLSLLSTVDADLDAQLLGKLCGLPIRQIAIASICVKRAMNNGFLFSENQSIYRWIAKHALNALKASVNKPTGNPSLTAIMPHHAGDVLFFAIAWQHTTGPITHLATNRSYIDIVQDNTPALSLEPLDISLINRSQDFIQGKVTTEGEYFSTIKSALRDDTLYFYLRPSRDYNLTRHHLIDHFAFALGRHFWQAADLLTQQLKKTSRYQRGGGDKAVRVLLFFDGGWPLKIYPQSLQQELIDLLHQRGYQVTVLAGAKKNYLNCAVTQFENYAQLKILLSSQDLVVGMDSFPTHLATHILRVPTICLFGSTRPENSNAPASAHYKHLETGLNCRPCYSIERCPRYGGSDCKNFTQPTDVAIAIDEMLLNLSKGNIENRPPHNEYLTDTPPIAEVDSSRPHYLTVEHRGIKAWLYIFIVRLTPSFSFLRQAHSEFMASLKRDGWIQTYLRTARFLKRQLSP